MEITSDNVGALIGQLVPQTEENPKARLKSVESSEAAKAVTIDLSVPARRNPDLISFGTYLTHDTRLALDELQMKLKRKRIKIDNWQIVERLLGQALRDEDTVKLFTEN